MGLLILLLSVFIAAIATVQFLPFYPELKPVAVSLPLSPKLEGPLAPNNALDAVEKIWHHIALPESVDIHDGWIYTGTADGNIRRLKDNVDEILIDRKCNDVATCNRPLGVRVVNNSVYVADPMLGVYKVNIKNKNVETIFDASVPVDGKLALLTDDLTLSRNGDIYITDASTRWGIQELHLSAIEMRPDGRILHYDPSTKTVRVLVDGLTFPNGIQLSPKEDFLVFCDSMLFQLQRYYLKGPKKGKVEIFTDNVPGIPDNVRASGRGTYWVALFHSRFGGKKTTIDYLSPHPEVRSYITRLLYLLILPLDTLDSFGITHNAYSTAKIMVGQFMLASGVPSDKRQLIIEVDQNGKILRSLQSTSDKISDITQVFEHNNALYITSISKNGIWKVNL